MKIAGVEVKRRVWAGTGGAALVIVTWMWWSQATLQAAGNPPKSPVAFVRLSGRGEAVVDRILRERAAFQDATPLFFPTASNFRASRRPDIRPTSEVFQDFGAVLKYEARAPRFGTEGTTPPETAPELMERGNEAPFAGFGQVDRPAETLPVRWGRIEAKSLLDGRLMLNLEIGAAGSPAVEYGTMEFVAKVGLAGLVGTPLLTQGSGRKEVDDFVLNYLVKTARIGAQLPPGTYRITVGP